MAAFDLKKSLKQIAPTLRQQLFSSWPTLAALDWDRMEKKQQIAPLCKAMLALSTDEMRDIKLLLRTFESLKRPCGLKVLLEELRQQNPALVQTWGVIKSRMDKVVWTYLNAKGVFEEAIIYARADHLTTTRYWHKWPGVQCGAFRATSDRTEALKRLLIDHHDGEFRGDQCEIHHYTRQNGAEYFFAYLPDWHDNIMVFTRSGELKALDLPTAFSILFVFTPTTGVLEMIASGDQATLASLRRRFYQAMTQTEVEDAPPDRPAFELDHLLSDGFVFSGHDTSLVESVGVTRIMVYPNIEHHDIKGLQPRFHMGIPWRRVIEQLDHLLTSIDLDRTQVSVEEVWIRIQCVGDGRRRGRVLAFRVTPRACTLKSVDDDELRVLGEQCLRAWEIDRD